MIVTNGRGLPVVQGTYLAALHSLVAVQAVPITGLILLPKERQRKTPPIAYKFLFSFRAFACCDAGT